VYSPRTPTPEKLREERHVAPDGAGVGEEWTRSINMSSLTGLITMSGICSTPLGLSPTFNYTPAQSSERFFFEASIVS